MKSSRGFLAALLFLLALPIGVLGQVVLGIDPEIIVHFVCAVGFALIAFAVFHFTMPRWIAWISCGASSALAIIFLLQGVSPLLHNRALTYLAFDVFGQQLETWLVDVLILWFVALLFFDSQGKTRIVGFVALSLVVGLEVYKYGLLYLGAAPADILKLVFFLPFVWLLLESRKQIAPGATPRLAPH